MNIFARFARFCGSWDNLGSGIAFFRKEIIPQNKTKPQHSRKAGAAEGLLLMFRFLLAISSSGANT